MATDVMESVENTSIGSVTSGDLVEGAKIIEAEARKELQGLHQVANSFLELRLNQNISRKISRLAYLANDYHKLSHLPTSNQQVLLMRLDTAIVNELFERAEREDWTEEDLEIEADYLYSIMKNGLSKDLRKSPRLNGHNSHAAGNGQARLTNSSSRPDNGFSYVLQQDDNFQGSGGVFRTGASLGQATVISHNPEVLFSPPAAEPEPTADPTAESNPEPVAEPAPEPSPVDAEPTTTPSPEPQADPEPASEINIDTDFLTVTHPVKNDEISSISYKPIAGFRLNQPVKVMTPSGVMENSWSVFGFIDDPDDPQIVLFKDKGSQDACLVKVGADLLNDYNRTGSRGFGRRTPNHQQADPDQPQPTQGTGTELVLVEGSNEQQGRFRRLRNKVGELSTGAYVWMQTQKMRSYEYYHDPQYGLDRRKRAGRKILIATGLVVGAMVAYKLYEMSQDQQLNAVIPDMSMDNIPTQPTDTGTIPDAGSLPPTPSMPNNAMPPSGAICLLPPVDSPGMVAVDPTHYELVRGTVETPQQALNAEIFSQWRGHIMTSDPSNNSLWRVGEHMLRDAGIKHPSVTQIDAVKDILVKQNHTFGPENWVNAGQRINVGGAARLVSQMATAA